MNSVYEGAGDAANIKEIFERAKKALESFGWITGSIGNENVGYCALGAIAYGARLFPMSFNKAVFEFEKFLREENVALNIASWNDHHDTTKDAVIKRFDRMIELFDSQIKHSLE